MAKQTFTTGSVLTATQMNNLQANDYNWSVDGKVASYVLVAADAGKRIEMNSGSATTITVNTGLFTAGDMVYLSNIGSGVCTVTAGTATVNKSTNASLALSQYQSGMLYFVSASSAIFYPFDIGSATSGKTYSLVNAGGTALSGSASTNITGITGDDILILVVNASSASASSNMYLTFNGITTNKYAVVGTQISAQSTYAASNFTAQVSAPDSTNSITLATMSNNAASVMGGYCRIYGAKSATVKPYLAAGAASASGGNGNEQYVIAGVFNDSNPITSVRIWSGVGNFDAGTIFVYEAQ